MVTAKLICISVLAREKAGFFHNAAHIESASLNLELYLLSNHSMERVFFSGKTAVQSFASDRVVGGWTCMNFEKMAYKYI